MNRPLKKAAAVFVAAFAAAQLVRPGRANPVIHATRTIEASAATPNEVASIVNRACRDCHSNATVWPWYSQVAPVSWVMAYGVTKGRRVVNFSEWGTYSREQQRSLLLESCYDVTNGRMPGAYSLVRPETRLSAHDIDAICATAGQSGSRITRRF